MGEVGIWMRSGDNFAAQADNLEIFLEKSLLHGRNSWGQMAAGAGAAALADWMETVSIWEAGR